MEKERESVEEGRRSVSGSFNFDFKLRFCEINARGLSHFPNTVKVGFDLKKGRKSKRDCEIKGFFLSIITRKLHDFNVMRIACRKGRLQKK